MLTKKLKNRFWKPQTYRYNFILKNLKEGKSIDLGSNEGGMHSYLKSHLTSKLLSVDIEGGDIKSDLNKKFPFENNSIDNIIAGEIIEHIYCPFNFLKECNRVLKKEGRLIITTPNNIGIPYLLNDKHGRDLSYTPHIYAFNMNMLSYLIKKVGFKIIKQKHDNSFYNLNLILRIMGFLFKRIRPTLIVIAEK